MERLEVETIKDESFFMEHRDTFHKMYFTGIPTTVGEMKRLHRLICDCVLRNKQLDLCLSYTKLCPIKKSFLENCTEYVQVPSKTDMFKYDKVKVTNLVERFNSNLHVLDKLP